MSSNAPFFLFLLLLVSTSLTLLVIPFFPAWREWRHPTDDGALVVAGGQTQKTINVVRQFSDKTWLEFSEGAVAIHQITSASGIYMARKCCFERLNAPVIHFGEMLTRAGVRKNTLVTNEFSMERVAGATQWGQNGWRVSGDLEIPAASFFKGSLVVTGFLSIGAGAQVEGDLKAYKGIFIGENTQVTGAIFCEDGIHISRYSNVGGPIVADTHLLIGFNCLLGSTAAQTTISANSMLIGNGVEAHGTVWAKQAGIVWGQA